MDKYLNKAPHIGIVLAPPASACVPIRHSGGLAGHSNARKSRKFGCRFDFENPEAQRVAVTQPHPQYPF